MSEVLSAHTHALAVFHLYPWPGRKAICRGACARTGARGLLVRTASGRYALDGIGGLKAVTAADALEMIEAALALVAPQADREADAAFEGVLGGWLEAEDTPARLEAARLRAELVEAHTLETLAAYGYHGVDAAAVWQQAVKRYGGRSLCTCTYSETGHGSGCPLAQGEDIPKADRDRWGMWFAAASHDESSEAAAQYDGYDLAWRLWLHMAADWRQHEAVTAMAPAGHWRTAPGEMLTSRTDYRGVIE